ncbi:MAG: DUF4392 domain-containing protein [Eubacteriales bacterium]|nr:DUF4392 domain-containing protein [Eubacteriales bacterium]
MNKAQLEKRNIGENLDTLMTLDPRGYGVCRILYGGCRKMAKEPLTIHAAQALCENLTEGGVVFLMTGFVLLPYKVPEMDGMVGTILTARALIEAFHVKPVVICPPECVQAVINCGHTAGYQVYEDMEMVKEMPLCMGVIPFTKDEKEAPLQAQNICETIMPQAMLAIEAPGANSVGKYHNAVGKDVTDLEAKTDVLWNLLRDKKVPSIAIGDLGNEIGMHSLGEHIEKFIPYTSKNECACGCGGGILAATDTDYLITATCSDWGCYGLIAAVAFLKNNIDIFHDEAMEAAVMREASRNGMIDMTGSLLPGIDGFDLKMNTGIVSMMRQCTEYALRHEGEFNHWYGPVLKKGYFDGV